MDNQKQIHHFQYTNVTLSSGDHEFTYPKFIELLDPKKGLTEVEMHAHLWDMHDAQQKPNSDGLKEGFFWTTNNTAVGMTPVARHNQTEPQIVSSESPDIALLMKEAPELFEYLW